MIIVQSDFDFEREKKKINGIVGGDPYAYGME